MPADFPEGLKFLPDMRLFVFREDNVFHAISAVCTHLGCTVRAEALPQPETRTVQGALARALVVWLLLALVFDLIALGAASFLRSGDASRLLIVASLVNPVDAARTGALLTIEGIGAFGPASLALLHVTHGPQGAVTAICVSLVLWTAVPLAIAARRLTRIDIL